MHTIWDDTVYAHELSTVLLRQLRKAAIEITLASATCQNGSSMPLRSFGLTESRSRVYKQSGARGPV